MSSSLIEMVTSPSMRGDAIRREERNWEDILPEMDALRCGSWMGYLLIG